MTIGIRYVLILHYGVTVSGERHEPQMDCILVRCFSRHPCSTVPPVIHGKDSARTVLPILLLGKLNIASPETGELRPLSSRRRQPV
jgi:hypothetical protein